jgi:hypothetical protein
VLRCSAAALSEKTLFDFFVVSDAGIFDIAKKPHVVDMAVQIQIAPGDRLFDGNRVVG